MFPIDSRKTPLTFDTIEPGTGLAAALKLSRAGIIAEISASNLRGRGGAGFPTGTKWNLAAAARVKDAGMASASTSSATRTKASPARSRTACCSRIMRTSSSRA